MGELLDKVNLNLLVNGDDIPDNFRNNSNFFYQKYLSSDDSVKSIDVTDIKPGYFYFLHYLDDSNWMKWAPVFITNYKKFSNKIIFFGVNFNMVPLEFRVLIFDKYMIDANFEKNAPLKVNFEGMYKELMNIGFEYSLMEFNAIQIAAVHRIHMEMVPRFLYSQHPKNKYDPNKLIKIWKKKLETRDLRHKEMVGSVLEEFYNVGKDYQKKFEVLKGHIDRIQKSMQKYGGG